jgi:hypothetical protein
MKKILSVSLLFVLIAGLFLGCEKKETPPSVPPVETMKIDFSEFISTQKSAATKGNANWFIASTTAGYWNTILILNLAVPIAAFQAVVSKTPVYLQNNKWQWSYDFNVVGATYKARLTGQVKSSNVKWEMYVERTGVGAFPEFMWFEGTSALDGKSGQWILYHSPMHPEEFLQIDWTVTGSKVGNIKYTYIRENKDDGSADNFKSSFIEYGLTTNTLNAFFNVHFNPTGVLNDFKDVNIEWSTTAHNGHIKSLYYFNDSNWRCWDGSGNDVTCN